MSHLNSQEEKSDVRKSDRIDFAHDLDPAIFRDAVFRNVWWMAWAHPIAETMDGCAHDDVGNRGDSLAFHGPDTRTVPDPAGIRIGGIFYRPVLSA